MNYIGQRDTGIQRLRKDYCFAKYSERGTKFDEG